MFIVIFIYSFFAAKVRQSQLSLSLFVTLCHYLSLFVIICHYLSLFVVASLSFSPARLLIFFRCKGTTLAKHVVAIKFIFLFLLCPSGLFFSFRCKGTTSCKHVVRFCPLLSAFVRFCPLLSVSVLFCPSLSVFVRLCPSSFSFRLLYFLYVKIIRNLYLAYGRLWSGLSLFLKVQNGSKSPIKCQKTLC